MLIWILLSRDRSKGGGESSAESRLFQAKSAAKVEAASGAERTRMELGEDAGAGVVSEAERGVRLSLEENKTDDERPTLTIRILDPTGRPCPEVDLQWSFDVEGTPPHQGVTDGEGTLVVDRPAGIRMKFLRAVPRTTQLALAQATAGRGLPRDPVETIQLELPWGGALQVLVTDVQGSPVKDQCVVCQTEYEEARAGNIVLGRTDALGVARFEGLAVGGWSCLAEGRRGYIQSERSKATLTRSGLAEASLLQEPLPLEDYASGTVTGLAQAATDEGFYLERYVLRVRGRNGLERLEGDASFFLLWLEKEGDRIEVRIEDQAENLASGWYELVRGFHHHRFAPEWAPIEPMTR